MNRADHSNLSAVIKGNEFIMPRAEKPLISARPKPAPSSN
ncbi:MAG: hypothetical protein JWL85_483 [Candidatus Saccharibacteria bacterium]|nr:hypothetical protein [Candidatus Saccharibacteria bacterium]